MYTRWFKFLDNKKIVLASDSVHRKDILKELGFKFDVITSNFPENLVLTSPKDYVEQTCKGKFDTFLKSNPKLDLDILITADTIKVFKDTIREKPTGPEDILKWLREYSNNGVRCLTSLIIGIISKDKDGNNYVKNYLQSTPETIVWFQELSDELIQDYIDSGEGYGKAGAIKIQGLAKTFIKSVEGCFFNVVGFPVQVFSDNLIKFSLVLFK